MKKILYITLCSTLLLGSCDLMDIVKKNKVPETVSVKDYDGRYIGEHKKRNQAFLKKHKAEAEKKYKDYVKEVFGKDVNITRTYSYTNPGPGLQSYEAIVVIGTVDYDVPFQMDLNFVESEGNLVINTLTEDQGNEILGGPSAMLYKRYKLELEAAREKFKKEVEKNGYYAMNKKLEKQQEYSGATDKYINLQAGSTIGVDEFKKYFKPIMDLQGEEFNQKMDKLIKKYPELKEQMRTDFIAYYDKKKENDVNKYSWDLQVPTNETMKKIPGKKSLYFWNGKVSPTEIDKYGRLESVSEEVSMDGGMWDEYKKGSK